MHLKFAALPSLGHRYRTLDKAMLGCLGALLSESKVEMCNMCNIAKIIVGKISEKEN